MINILISSVVSCVYYYLLLFVIFFMQGIYSYIPKTNRVCRVLSVAAVCSYNLCYMSWYCMFNVLDLYINTSKACVCVCVCARAMLNMVVFCSPFSAGSSGTLFRYSLNDFYMVSVAPFMYYYRFCFYVPRALYFHFMVFIPMLEYSRLLF